jgi:hypothetical protein
MAALFGWWGNQRLRQTVEEELRADLASTLDADVTALQIWMTDQAKLASALADEPGLRALALDALADRSGSRAGEMGEYLRFRLEGLGYEIAQLVSTNFVVVASSRPGRVPAVDSISEANFAKFWELFTFGQPVIVTPFKPRHRIVRRPSAEPGAVEEASSSAAGGTTTSSGDLAGMGDSKRAHRGSLLMQVAAPVRDDDGKIRGALALVINPDQEFTRILSVARAGKSGETYVVDQDGVMLSQSRFDGELKQLGLLQNAPGVSSAATLRLADPGHLLKTSDHAAARATTNAPLMRLVANAIAGGIGTDVQPSRDYRGVPVVGAWRWVPRHGFGVITQLDAEEAFKPLRVLDWLFVMLVLLLVLFAIGMFMFSLFGVLWRRRLSEAELKLKQLGQYTLDEKIGEGAMGVVYRAHHALMRRNTAVKLLTPDRADPATVKRFEREVRVTCQLTHPNTIQVYDYGHTPEGVFYYAMELLQGLNLHQLVTQFGPQPESRVIYILSQVCDALAEAHALGLVHRDVKPGNIFVCDRGGVYDWVKVLDFGLVRGFRAGQGTRPPMGLDARAEGTPLFMPPEAFRDSARSDPRSDIYSLGALGYFLLTAQFVFEGNSDAELYQKHLNETPVAPGQRTINLISAELEETILRCLEKEPNLRPQSANELRQLLQTSPHAGQWSLEARAAWWTRYHARNGRVGERAAGEAKQNDARVKMNLAERVKTSHAN